MDWKIILLILCIFGFLKEFRPSEVFVSDQLTGHWKNFTDEQVIQEIYPISIYSYLATLVLVFLLTDLLLYKPVIILSGISGTVTFITLIFGTTIPLMQFLEFTYGLFMSTEVAYYTYIYAKVDKKYYEKATGYTRAAFLMGKFIAGLVAQLLVYFRLMDYFQLNYLTLTALILATIFALFLPSVHHSIYFHRNDVLKTKNEYTASTLYEIQDDTAKSNSSFLFKFKQAYIFLWKDFLQAYSNPTVLKWSFWWALATCGYSQIITYSQLLWRTAVEENADIYNGAVEAIYTIIGAVSVCGIGLVKINWTLYGEGILAFFSILDGVLLLVASETLNIWIMYGCYIAFGVIYHTIVTVASFEVAKRLSEDSYGLIFGINTFIALIVQSLLTFFVVSDRIFDSNIRLQYFIYSCYFDLIGIIFAIFAIITVYRYYRNSGSFNNFSKSTECINIEQNRIERMTRNGDVKN